MRFWDSSALFPLCYEEPRTGTLKALQAADPAITAWWAALVECQSALARRMREGRVGVEQGRQIHSSIQELASTWIEVQPTDEVRRRAGMLLRSHRLRAADALQLAAALVWAGELVDDRAFVSLDDRLRDAAAREGFTVLP